MGAFKEDILAGNWNSIQWQILDAIEKLDPQSYTNIPQGRESTLAPGGNWLRLLRARGREMAGGWDEEAAPAGHAEGRVGSHHQRKLQSKEM